MKVYKAKREFIGRDSVTGKLYELEAVMNRAIVAVVEWRTDNFNEDYWTRALPQTLLTILEGYERKAGEVTATLFLDKLLEVVEIKDENEE